MPPVETPIAPEHLNNAVELHSTAAQTSLKLHQELLNDDASGLVKTASDLSPKYIGHVEDSYKSRFGTTLSDDISRDEGIPRETRDDVTKLLREKKEAHKDEIQSDPAKAVNLFDTLEATVWLTSKHHELANERFNAHLGRHQETKGQTFVPHNPFNALPLYGQEEANRDIAAGRLAWLQADMNIRKSVDSLAPHEIKALHDYGKNVTDRSVLSEITRDKNLSPETRSFVSDLLKKHGVDQTD